MKPRIQWVFFDAQERPLRAVVLTSRGPVRIHWQDVAGDWCWFTEGNAPARREAAALAEKIERMCHEMHASV